MVKNVSSKGLIYYFVQYTITNEGDVTAVFCAHFFYFKILIFHLIKQRVEITRNP